MTDTGQPDGDVFLCKSCKPGYVLAAVGKPIAAHEDNAVFNGQRVQKTFNDTGQLSFSENYTTLWNRVQKGEKHKVKNISSKTVDFWEIYGKLKGSS